MSIHTSTRAEQIALLEKDWAENPRWKGVKRGYTAADVVQPARFAAAAEHAGRARRREAVEVHPRGGLHQRLGALTGGQAVQQVKAGVKAIYLSGWQVAADNNSAQTMYPDQSLYPVDSVPAVVRRINNAFRRADQIQWANNIGPGRSQATSTTSRRSWPMPKPASAAC